MKCLLLRAAASSGILELIYEDYTGNLSQCKIKILTVNDESFHAYCYMRKQQRTFKMSNILSIGPERKMKRGA